MSKGNPISTAAVIMTAPKELQQLRRSIQLFRHEIVPAVRGWRCTLLILRCTANGEKTISPVEPGSDREDVQVLHQTAHDIAVWYQSGICRAVSTLKADAVVLLGENTPSSLTAVPDLLHALEKGADMAIGSRCLKGEECGSFLKLKTKMLLLLESIGTRLLLFFPTRMWFRVTDPTSGLMAFDSSLYTDQLKQYLELESGKRFFLTLLYGFVRTRARVKEVQVAVSPTAAGERRTSETLRWALRLRWRDLETKRFVRFGVVGFTGYVINASALEIFRHSRLSDSIARYFVHFPHLSRLTLLTSQSAWSAGLAAELAIVSNYLLNNFWTFSSHRIHKPLRFLGKLLQFNLTSFGGIVIQFLVVGAATQIFADTAAVRGVALVFAIVFLIIPYNWTIYNRLIWRVKGRRKKR
jgi:dolichol-phosphate mannosyltransferase